ncbi:diadenylate cyclase [Clostridiales Family XIII bacterium PM5-7]
MNSFINNLISSISITDTLDILIVAFVIYKVLGFIRETRAQQLVKGLLVLVVAFFLSDLLKLYTLNWILKGTMTLGVVALVVVFQPELRRGLEYVGRSKIVKPPFGVLDKEKAKKITDEFVKAVDSFSSSKTGALIILEREIALSDIAESGTQVNGDISAELLENIFYEGAPLHDGAAIIRGESIFAAGCVLPLTENKNLNKSLGTRHRAGIGITENSDAIAIIVSEETGVISMAIDGKLTRFLDTKTVEKTLLNLYLSGGSQDATVFNQIIDKLGRNRNAKG